VTGIIPFLLGEAPDYFLTLGVKVQVQPAFFWIIDFLSGEMLKLSESGSAIPSITGDGTTNASGRVVRPEGMGLRLPVQNCTTSTTG
jgi:hypothetical protein